MPFGEDGRCLIIQWDDSVCINRMAQGKEFPGSLSHCLVAYNLGVLWKNIWASVLMTVQILWNISSLTSKAPLGLDLYVWSVGNLEVTRCGPPHPWPKKGYQNSKGILGVIWVTALSKPFYSLIGGYLYLIVTQGRHSVMSAASSFHCFLFSVSVASHWDFGLFVMELYHSSSWLLHGIFYLNHPDDGTNLPICIAVGDLPLKGQHYFITSTWK